MLRIIYLISLVLGPTYSLVIEEPSSGTGSSLKPDPRWDFKLDQDPYKMTADSKHCAQSTTYDIVSTVPGRTGTGNPSRN